MIQKNILKLVALVVVFLACFQLLVSHRLGTAGQHLRDLEERSIGLEKENRLLRTELAKQASLSQIEEKGRKLGLMETTLVLDLTEQPALAQNQ